MAEEVTIGGDGSLFVGEDKILRFELAAVNADGTISATAAVDMTGWVMVFDVRRKDNSRPPAMISFTPTLTGAFNALRASNTQRALVPLSDDLLNLFKEDTYRWSWKRMDGGVETVLGWGDFTPQKATAP